MDTHIMFSFVYHTSENTEKQPLEISRIQGDVF